MGGANMSNVAYHVAYQLIAEVAKAGGRLIPKDGGLIATADSALPDDLMRRLREHKPALLQALSEDHGHDKPWRQRVLAMLRENPAIERALVTDAESARMT
jgi:hypothetical protein